jgi:prepilin-type N-terminal cleavage/methylation domain-containing protein
MIRNKPIKKQPQFRRGFTLIELLVVIAILGILSTLSMVAFSAARAKARTAKAQHDVDQILLAVQAMSNDTGEWPGHQPMDYNCGASGTCVANNEICGDGCANNLASAAAGIAQDDSGAPYANWNGPYMARIPLDPWGNEYFFDSDYDHTDWGWSVVVGSYGPDGVGNNLYNADDIVKKLY